MKNQLVHNYLMSHGYTHEHVPAHWEEIGDAENGPELDGHEAYDLYTSAEYRIVIDAADHAHIERRDLEREEYEAEMEWEQKTQRGAK